jgi:hypothetical protein
MENPVDLVHVLLGLPSRHAHHHRSVMLYVLSLAARLMGANLRPLAERSNMIQIPALPEGIADRTNLYNDVYGDLPPLSWDTPEFHDRLAWACESVPGAKPVAWYYSTNSFGTSTIRTSTMVRIECVSVGIDIDVRNIWLNPDLLVYALKREMNPTGPIPQGIPYPGFEARNPTTDLPIGAAWPDHPWKGRAMYHDAAPERFAPGAEWVAVDGRYIKRQYQVSPGSGPFGTGGKMGTAWEKVYSR